MAFPSLAEIKSNIAVKEAPVESAPTTEASAPTPETPDTPEDSGNANESEVNTGSADMEQEAQSVEMKPEETSEESRIPYNRFKEKVDQVNTLKETNDLLMQQVERLRQESEVEEAAAVPEEANPFMERLEALDEYTSDSDMVSVMKDMAQELNELRSKTSNSEKGVREIRVAEQVQKIESEISSITGGKSIHDKDAARVFILQSLSQNPKQDIDSLADHFAGWEKSQEEMILKRLGVNRPASEKKEVKAGAPDVPPRPAHAGTPEPTGEVVSKKRVTLKDLRKTLGTGRRR